MPLESAGQDGQICYCCRQGVDCFLPYRDGLHSFSDYIRGVDYVTGDVERFYCPKCRCFDRERHLFMYFDRLDMWQNMVGARILHIAPEPTVRSAIAGKQPEFYFLGDLKPKAEGIRPLDVTAQPFQSGFFDLVICNHVLEHVADDAAAMLELHRVLAPGGRAILQTPFARKLKKTREDPVIDTDELRYEFYGQEDHLRLYGRDFFQRLEAAGFELEIQYHEQLFDAEDAYRYGVSAEEELILVRKPSESR